MQPQVDCRLQVLLATLTVKVVPCIVFTVALLSAVSTAQPPAKIATDYEWQLAQPGRTLFRDKLPVGQIALVSGRKEKVTGELLQILTDIAFAPGDTVRHFAATIRVFEGERIYSEVVVDANELAELIKAARFIVQTAADIASTARSETDITFHTRAGFSLEFRQVGTEQLLQFAVPDPLSDGEIIRVLSTDQLRLFSDLLDLTIFELNRQGAGIKVAKLK